MIVEYGFNKCQTILDDYDVIGKDKLVYEFRMKEVEGDSDLYDSLLPIYRINLKHLKKIIKKDYNSLEKYYLFEMIGMIFMTKNKEELEKIAHNNLDLAKIKKIIADIHNDNGLIEQYSNQEIEMMA